MPGDTKARLRSDCGQLMASAAYFPLLQGYCTGDPKNRLRYHCTIIMVLCHISMTGMILRWATELLLGA